MISLTRRQQEVYDFLAKKGHLFNHPPTLDELCHAMGLKSRGSMHKHIQALIEAGLIEPMDQKRRGIRLSDSNAENEDDLIPFLGVIAAGHPIEAIENVEPMMVPPQLRTQRSCFVLKVRGDSMIDDGILDGDWVVIERRDQARNGEIVVALIEGEEATLKRIEQRPGRLILHPANSTMEPMIYTPDQVQIQGILVGQMRSYG